MSPASLAGEIWRGHGGTWAGTGPCRVVVGVPTVSKRHGLS